MKSKIYHLTLILLSLNLYSQNLIVNPSFELYTECPNATTFGQFNAVSWFRPINMSNSSPDYFNICATTPNLSIPTNFFGVQSAYEGNAYTGIYCHENGNYREYIETQLSSPLLPNHSYQVSFFVSLADNFQLTIDKIGAVLTNFELEGNGTSSPISATPQIFATETITNSSGWTEISGIYHASGGEEFLTIGNFYNNAQTQTTIVNPSSAYTNVAYFFIDNVSITDLNLSISENGLQKFNIYPNPFTSGIHIKESNQANIDSFEIYSSLGFLITKIEFQDYVDLSYLSNGVYYLVLNFNDSTRYFRKIIKI